MNWRIAVLPGDGVGSEVIDAAVLVLRATAERFGHEASLDFHDVGWTAYDHHGVPLPEDTLEACRSADAVLLGAVGDPRGDGLDPELRPEAALLALRREMGCFANLRPVRLVPALADASPLRRERVDGTDLVIVRELAGGIYYGEPRGAVDGGRAAVDTMRYHRDEVVRIAKVAFETARGRRRQVLSIDKANVLHSSRLWREVVDGMAEEYPDVECHHMLVDRAAMELVLNPAHLDVMLTPNLFGDVLSDEAAAVVGSIGLLPSASIGGGGGIFEPVHGSAPDIAGTGTANPLAMILSAALLLRHVYGLDLEARTIETAVERVLEDGLRTPDLGRNGESTVGTEAMGEAVADAVVKAEAAASADTDAVTGPDLASEKASSHG